MRRGRLQLFTDLDDGEPVALDEIGHFDDNIRPLLTVKAVIRRFLVKVVFEALPIPAQVPGFRQGGG